jgi:hypothetical protein
MSDAVASALQAHQTSARYEMLALTFACECAERVRHLLEDEGVMRCLDVLQAYLRDAASRGELDQAATEVASRARQHQGSRSLDGVGHAAVSASYAVANALAGRAVQAADYAAYAAVYGGGGYGAVSDPESFVAERDWQLAMLGRLANDLAVR